MTYIAPIIERNITVNAPLRDGTPRRETGYRPHIRTYPGPLTVNAWWRGPLFKTEAEAKAWNPMPKIRARLVCDCPAWRLT